MRYSLLILAFVFAGPARATLTFASATGVSSYVINGATTTTAGTGTIYGGTGGTDCSAAASSLGATCNSCQSPYNTTCTTTPLCACNESRIYPNLIMHINLTRAAAEVGTAKAVFSTAGTSSTTPITLSSTNDGSYIEFPWSIICNQAGSATCTGLATDKRTQTMTIFLDKNNDNTYDTGDTNAMTLTFIIYDPTGDDMYSTTKTDGIKSFTVYRGDEKVTIENLSGDVFPVMSYGGTASKLRVFRATTNLDDAQPNGAGVEHNDLEIDTTDTPPSLVNGKVTGLTNEQLYFFRVAVLDVANNVVQYFPENVIGTNYGVECTTAPTSACLFSARPDQVIGLLEKDLNCFVATAAYGSSLEPKLQMLREFRHEVLLQHAWGLWFVKKYYAYGPYAARFIQDKPVLRTLVRGALWPLLGFSWLSLRFGFLPATLLFMLLSSAVGVMGFAVLFRRQDTRV